MTSWAWNTARPCCASTARLCPLRCLGGARAHDAPLDAAPGRYASASALRALVRAGGAAALAPHVPPSLPAAVYAGRGRGRHSGRARVRYCGAVPPAGYGCGRVSAPCGARPRAWRTGSPPPFRAQARWTSWCRPCGQNDMRRRVCAVWCWTRPWDTPGICLHCRPICMCWEQMKRALRYCAAHVRRLCCRCLIRWADLAARSAPAARVAAAHAAAEDLTALCLRHPAPMGAAYTAKPVFPTSGAK